MDTERDRTAEAGPPGADAPLAPGAIRIRYRPTLRDHLLAGAWTGRQSDVFVGLGVAMLIGAVLALVVRDVVPFIGLLVAGLSLVSGWFSSPFVWWAFRSQPDVAGSDTEDVIDAGGIEERTPRLTANIAWSTYRSVTETRHAFYLANGLGTGFLPKRAFSLEQLVQFRELVRGAGLAPRRRGLRRLAVLVAVPIVFMLAAATPLALRHLNVSPRIEVTPTLEGSTARVAGTTDLPDGAILSVGVLQVEEYAKSVAAGGPATADSEWVRYRWVAVRDGRFEASFPTGDWPPGRLRAAVFFDMALQSDELVERYGAEGERLAGPDVEDGEDGRQVEISKNFPSP